MLIQRTLAFSTAGLHLSLLITLVVMIAVLFAVGHQENLELENYPRVWLGAFASLAAGLATGIGALAILLMPRISQKLNDTLLGFGAGVMLAATSFSLIVPGIAAAGEIFGGKLAAVSAIALGILMGGWFLWKLDKLIPHEHFIKGREGENAMKLKKVWLFVFAIALHNFPEGLAVGVGFGDGNAGNGIALATGIGLQNIPEGLVVALAMLSLKYSKGQAIWIAVLTGLIEPIGGLFGAGLLALAQTTLPWALAFAAGAMLFVISHEIIPESHRMGHEAHATFGTMAGFVIMMMLDTTLSVP